MAKVKEMTQDELEQFIEQKVIEILGDPDEGLSLNEAFKEKLKKGNKDKILFLGRIAPIKNVGVLIKAIKLLNNKKINLVLAGPVEQNYGKELKNLVHNLGIENQISFIGPVCGLKKKIRLIRNSGIFVLPSKREAMPQSLLEAMALGKIVVSSGTKGGKEFIVNGKNGFLFYKNNEKELAKMLDYCMTNFNRLSKIRLNAKKYASNLKWADIADRLEKLYMP